MKSLRRIFSQSKSDLALRCPNFVVQYDGKEDPFGLDLDYFAKRELYLRFLREDHFSTRVFGIENIPDEGAAIIAGNHNGTMPVDLFMLKDAVLNLHPQHRLIRFLVHDCFYWDDHLRTFMCKMGEVRATYANAIQVLERNELVGIYPAGERAMGQPLSNRYNVGEFRSGCVRAALETQSPIIPVVTIGNAEIYPMIWNAKFLANLFQVPYFGISPQFPLLPFPVSTIPFPIKWLIHFGKPIHLKYPSEAASNRELVNKITLDLQIFMQNELDELLALRKTYMRGWDAAEVEDWVQGRQHEFAQRT